MAHVRMAASKSHLFCQISYCHSEVKLAHVRSIPKGGGNDAPLPKEREKAGLNRRSALIDVYFICVEMTGKRGSFTRD